MLKQEEIRKDDNCVLHIIDKAGHNSNQDNPELVNQLIYSLLNRDK
ncbi:alpha/beta hydrolase [Terrisporobacter petrolearius]